MAKRFLFAFILSLSFFFISCYIEEWSKCEIINNELIGKTNAEVLNDLKKYKSFFIDDMLIAVRIHPKEFLADSQENTFICSLYVLSPLKNKTVVIDEISSPDFDIEFSPLKITLDSNKTEFIKNKTTEFTYFYKSLVLFEKKGEEYPKNFLINITAHSEDNYKKLISYNFYVVDKHGYLKLITDYF